MWWRTQHLVLVSTPWATPMIHLYPTSRNCWSSTYSTLYILLLVIFKTGFLILRHFSIFLFAVFLLVVTNKDLLQLIFDVLFCFLTALFPFITPVLEKLDISIFPTEVTDFFYTSLQKIKTERVAQNRKVEPLLVY